MDNRATVVVTMVNGGYFLFHLSRDFSLLICKKRNRNIITIVAPIIRKYSTYPLLGFLPGQAITLMIARYISSAMVVMFIFFISSSLLFIRREDTISVAKEMPLPVIKLASLN